MISALSKMLQARTRQEDIACRYGGEEFCSILRGSAGRGMAANRTIARGSPAASR